MNLNDAYAKLATLKGEMTAITAMTTSLLASLSDDQLSAVLRDFSVRAEIARSVMLKSGRIGETGISAFDATVLHLSSMD